MSEEEGDEEFAIIYESVVNNITNLCITANESRESTTSGAEAVLTAGEYYVEEIRDHCLHPNGQMQYLLKWEDYPEEENSWQLETDVTDCHELLQRFRSETVNGRHPPKESWEEYDKFVDYVEWTVGQGLQDLAVLHRMSDHKHTVAELRSAPKLVKQWKREMKRKIGHFFTLEFDRNSNEERLQAMDAVQEVAQHLRLEANGFETLTEWFEFIDRQSEVSAGLSRFALTCNKVIADKREGLKISVTNDYDLEVPVLEQYVGECVYDNTLFPKSKGCAAGDTSLVSDDSRKRVAEHPFNSPSPTSETLVSNADKRVVTIDLDMDSMDEIPEYFLHSYGVSCVDGIRDHSIGSNGQIQSLLKCKGCPEENSWELSWEELDAFTKYLKLVVSPGYNDLAVLYRLSHRKHTVAELRANQKLVITLKTNIEAKVRDFFGQKFDRKTNLERHRAMQAVKDVAKRLKLEANGFPTLTDWFDFIDWRHELADRLAATCNKEIAKKREGLEISVSNDYDLEVPELEQYVGESYTLEEVEQEEEEELTRVDESLVNNITNLRITSNEWRDTVDTNTIRSKSKSNVWPNTSQPMQPISYAVNTSATSRRAESVNTSGKKCVEEIRDHHIHSSGQIQYLLKWKDFPEEKNSWKFETHVTDCQELLQRFRSETVNGRHPPKESWEELDEFTKYLKLVVSPGFDDSAVLYRLSDHKLRSTSNLMNRLKRDIEKKIGTFFTLTFDRNSNPDRHRAMKEVENVAKQLRLKANDFPTLTDWFEFIDRRFEMPARLARFALTCNKVIADKREGVEISVSNDYDLEVPELEEYVGECVSLLPMSTATDAEKYTLRLCECENCYDERLTCCLPPGFAMVYDGKGLHRKYLLKEIPNPMIFECTHKCRCGAECPNRVIQRGRQYRLEIYRPPDAVTRGWAVRSLDPIPSGAFVSNYSGEIISSTEANNRSNIYLFDANWPECPYIGTVGNRANQYVIDAYKKGNVSRFINHSCDPNCKVFYSYIHSDNKQLPTVSLFTIKEIKPYEELTYDYGSGLKNSPDSNSQLLNSAGDGFNTTIDLTEEEDSNDNDVSTGVANGGGESRPAADRPERLALNRIECHCGSKYCRNFLYS